MRPPETASEVWAALEALEGRPLDPEVVAFLQKRAWAEDVLSAVPNGAAAWRGALKQLQKEYRAILRLRAAPARPTRGRSEVAEDRTLEALARLLALEAERRPDVQAFRSAHLGGGTLSLPEAEGLLQGWAREGEPTGETLWVPSQEGEAPDDWEWVLEFGGGEAAFQERRLPVTEGPLVELKALASRLLARYPWTEASAVALVACGLVPGVVVVRVRYVPGLHPLRLEAVPWVRAGELAEALQGFRADTPQLFRRHRMLSEKHLALALFAAEREGRRWRELLLEWNGAHPDWAYGRLSNFVRDAHQARRRLRSWAATAGP